MPQEIRIVWIALESKRVDGGEPNRRRAAESSAAQGFASERVLAGGKRAHGGESRFVVGHVRKKIAQCLPRRLLGEGDESRCGPASAFWVTERFEESPPVFEGRVHGIFLCDPYSELREAPGRI